LARSRKAQLGEGGLTREGTGLGPPDYMAPEQLGAARRVDPRADIYALGCTLYHLLTGQVPFPGSSLTEKAQAHEQQEPPSIEERCPEAPAGLVFVVQRMMAKRPGDRFQTASEVAEALAPYVASSSGSVPELRRTTSWHGSQLSFTVPRPRRRRLRWAIAGVASLTLLALALYFGSWLFRGAETSSGTDPEVVTIPNGFTVAKDGTGQFSTINEALKAVRPKMTIRVLDDATYAETFTIDDPAKHEGVTLEAPKHAVLELPTAAEVLAIRSVSGFRFKGFRIRERTPKTGVTPKPLLVVSGSTPGAVLESLDFEITGTAKAIALGVANLTSDEPLVVGKCTFRGGSAGIHVID